MPTIGRTTTRHARVPRSNRLTDGLAVHWPFQEKGFPKDIAGGYDATTVVNLPSGDGPFGPCVTSLSSNTAANNCRATRILASTDPIVSTSAFTIALWARIDSVAASGSPLFGVYFGTDGTSQTIPAAYGLEVNTTGFVAMHTGIGGVNRLTASSFNVVDSIWHDFALTWDGAKAIYYCDGISRLTSNWSGAITAAAATLALGSYFTVGTRSYTGAAMAPALWTRALAPQEIITLAMDPGAILRMPWTPPSVFVPAAPSVLFRKSLSPLGGKVGKRQEQGMVA